ncbi:MAG: release factor glutamine methyltransferase [bacterium]|nr:MAG: release factor glutamine methyltransferase [bacterium]
MNDKTWTILRLLNWTSQYFSENGIENPRLDAEVLLAHSLRTNRLRLYLNYDKPILKGELREYKKLIKRRIRREPLQYITGYQEFWSLNLKVTKGVLIPRPETEILVEEALKTFPQNESFDKTINILELGTGSGAVAIALAKELQRGSIVATDISDIAIKTARENAKVHGLEEQITFLKGSLFEPVRERIGTFNLVISNPPYIPIEDFRDIQPEVRDFEPRISLNGGKEGLKFYRQIFSQIGRYLAKDGWVILELGKGQAEKVTRLIELTGEFNPTSIIKDFSGIERVVKAQKKIG